MPRPTSWSSFKRRPFDAFLGDPPSGGPQRHSCELSNVAGAQIFAARCHSRFLRLVIERLGSYRRDAYKSAAA